MEFRKIKDTNLGIIISLSIIFGIIITGFVIGYLPLIIVSVFLPILFIKVLYDIINLPSNFINILSLNKALKENRVKIINQQLEYFRKIDILWLEIDNKEYTLWIWEESEGNNYTLSERYPDGSYTSYIELFVGTIIVKRLKRKTLEQIALLRPI